MNINELLDECDRAYANNDYSRLDWACSSILEEDKTNETALTYRLYIFCDWRQYHLVFRLADKIQRIYPENPHPYNAMAIVHMDKKEFEKALGCCEEGLKIRDHQGLRKNKIEALISLNRIGEALKFYNNSPIPDYDFTEALINCAKYSLITFDEMSKSEVVEYLLERCSYLKRRCEYRELIEACNAVLEIDRDNEEALVMKIYSLGDDDEVFECADYAISIYPENPMFYFIKAENIQGDLDEAIALYEKGFSLSKNPESHWFYRDQLVDDLHERAEQLEKEGKYDDAVKSDDKILYYKKDDFKALDRLEELISKYNINYKPTGHCNESLQMRTNARKRAEKVEDQLKNIIIGEYDDDYVKGCSVFKDYKSIDEYIRDIIIVLMESYPGRSEDQARFLVKCDMGYIKSAYENEEPADYCAIGVGYCCG